MMYWLQKLRNAILVQTLIIAILAGCGGGSGGSGAGSPGGGADSPPIGGSIGGDGTGGSASSSPPVILSVAPTPDATDVKVDSIIKMTFDKAMDSRSFTTGFEISPIGNGAFSSFTFRCVDGTECKTIRAVPGSFFEYDRTYTVTLKNDLSGVRDIDGLKLTSPFPWSFSTVSGSSFLPDLGFQRLKIDGGGINGINDAGECTAVAVDSHGTIHITYLSVSEWSVKHTFCPSNMDCSLLSNWPKEIIDGGPPQSVFTPSHGIGRDQNMAIDSQDHLHIVYRDYSVGSFSGDQTDNFAILKYATNQSGTWRSVKIDDTTDGVTDPYVKVGSNGRIHVSYRRANRDSAGEIVNSLSYATCSAADCATNPSSWRIVDIEGGSEVGNNEFATPSSIFVTGSAVHVSYHANHTLRYATCTLTDPATSCMNAADWRPTVLVDASDDVGTDSSLFVRENVVHITYRDNTNGDLKYAQCSGGCTDSGNWKTAAVDTVGDVGAISRLVLNAGGRLHVAYRDRSNADLKYATCTFDCLTPENWSLYRIDAPGKVGRDTYIALGPDEIGNPERKVHISYRDDGNKALKYAWGSVGP